MAKGNGGNLLQHWVLCDLAASVLSRVARRRIAYVDCYAMKPFECVESSPCSQPEFHAVLSDTHRLKSDFQKALCILKEEIWRDQRPHYPSSLVLLSALQVPLARAVLCECHREKAEAIELWCRRRDLSAVVWPTNWRHVDIRSLLEGDERALVLALLDPNVVSLSENTRPENMSIVDLERLLGEITVTGETIVQISSYSSNGGNSGAKVRPCVRRLLGEHDFSAVFEVCQPKKGRAKLRDSPWSIIAGRFTSRTIDLQTAFEEWGRSAQCRFSDWFPRSSVG